MRSYCTHSGENSSLTFDEAFPQFTEKRRILFLTKRNKLLLVSVRFQYVQKRAQEPVS